MLQKFEKHLRTQLPESQLTLNILEYVKKTSGDLGLIWEQFYDLHFRLQDMEAAHTNVLRRLDALEKHE